MAKSGARRMMFQPLNCLYLVLTLLLCVLTEVLAFERAYNKAQNEAETALNTQVSAASTMLADAVADTRDAYIMHSMDDQMNRILSGEDEPYTLQYIVESQYLKDAVYYFLSSNPLFADIGFVRREGAVVTYGSLTSRDKAMLDQVTAAYPLGTDYLVSPVYDNLSLLGNQKRFLVVREMFQNTKRESIGFMAFFLNVEILCQRLDNRVADMPVDGGVILLEQDTVVHAAARNDGVSGPEGFAAAAAGMAGGLVRFDGHSYAYQLAEEPATGWKVLGYYDRGSVLMQAVQDNLLLHGAILVIFVILVAIELRSFHFLNRTVYAMKEAMQQAEKGRFVQLDGVLQKNAELHTVVSGFNQMSASLQQLVYDNYVARLRRKEAELKMLRLQINPHFLYNTLNLIRSLAVLGENDQVARITENVGQMFRYNMGGDSRVRVRDEIELLHRYCEIQQVRFPGKLRLEWEVDESLLDCPMEKFTLQPLVENIFKHNRLHDPLRICIRVQPDGEDTMRLEVWNSGPGMDPERLAAVQKDLEEGNAREKETSIGLLNVNERIRLAFGAQYGVTLYSEPGRGVLARVTMPRCAGKQEERTDELSDRG